MGISQVILPDKTHGFLPYRRGVGAALFNNEGRVWLGRRILRPGREVQNYWQLPQGGIDDGEDPAAAVIRELYEETGTAKAEIIGEIDGWLSYDLPSNLLGKVWRGKYRGQAQKWFALQFNGNDTDFNLKGHEKPEFDAWRWAELAVLPDLIVPFKHKIYKRVADEFSVFSSKLSS